MAATALHVEPGTNPLERYLQALGHPDGLVRHEARVHLVAIGHQAVPGLVETLRSANPEARWEAAKALTEVRDQRAAEPLVALLTDDVPGVRWLAAEALAFIGRAALEPVLAGLIAHSGSAWYREGAHHVLRELARDALRERLAPVLMALEGIEPEIGVLLPAHELLMSLGPQALPR